MTKKFVMVSSVLAIMLMSFGSVFAAKATIGPDKSAFKAHAKKIEKMRSASKTESILNKKSSSLVRHSDEVIDGELVPLSLSSKNWSSCPEISSISWSISCFLFLSER